MAERPILFSGPLVRAILAGHKTQTRRLVTPGTSECESAKMRDLEFNAPHYPHRKTVVTAAGRDEGEGYRYSFADGRESRDWYIHIPAKDHDTRHRVYCRVQADDVLWVREAFAPGGLYRATWKGARPERWQPSIHMPKTISRIRLFVVRVRAEPLHTITEDDARAEGCEPLDGSYRLGFSELWDELNAKRRPWSSNPWVWVYELEVSP